MILLVLMQNMCFNRLIEIDQMDVPDILLQNGGELKPIKDWPRYGAITLLRNGCRGDGICR